MVAAIGTELAAENRLPNIPLNLENDRAALRFTTEVENEPWVRFRPDQKVKQWRGLMVVAVEFEPAIVEGIGRREGSWELNGEEDMAQKLGTTDATIAAHWADINGDGEDDGLAGEAAESCGVEVESGSGSS